MQPNTSSSTAGAVRAEPNVAPMIDVMLVLIVIFMIVVPAVASGPEAVPPRGEHLAPRPEEVGDQTLVIDRRGDFFLNRRPIPHDALRAALDAALAARPEDHVLYVRADRELDYRVVQDAIAVASAAGVRVVGMVAEKTPR